MSHHVPSVNAITLGPILRQQIDAASRVMSDEGGGKSAAFLTSTKRLITASASTFVATLTPTPLRATLRTRRRLRVIKRFARPDLLETGIYTIREAAGLVDAPQASVRVWIEGHTGKQDAVIDKQLGRCAGTSAVIFVNLMELRFIAKFVGAGVGLRDIRRIMQEAQHSLKYPDPFSTKIIFRTDGRMFVADIARRNGLDLIYDLRSKNYEMPSVVMKSLLENVISIQVGRRLRGIHDRILLRM